MSQERLKVLLIEHDPGFASRIGEMLGQARDLPTEVSSTLNLADGLDRIAANTFDVVVLDVCVPDGAGLANVALIQAEAPHLPIIVAGEMDDEQVAVEAVHCGAQDYLVKGQLTPGWLERSIRYAIERHRLDRAMLSAEEKYHSVFDHLVEGIFQTTPEGRYVMANLALARIYGYSTPEELMATVTDIGRRLYVKPGRREEFVRFMQDHDVLTSFESEIYRKDGSTIWISENCRAVRNKERRLLYFEGTVEDITVRRGAEKKLRDSETLYHSLVETLPQNIFRKDLEGRFTFCNQHFCKAIGKPYDEIIGKTDLDFFPAALAKKYQQDDQRVMTTGTPYQTVEEYQSPEGRKKMYVQVVKTPLKEADGRTIGLQGIFWDITEQRMNEEKIRRVNLLLAENRKVLRARHVEMTDDLKMAREIQLTMLPQQYPSFPIPGDPARSAFLFTHRYLPAGTVGGDFFTVSALSETEAGVFICDVAGHGVRSALVTAMIRAIVEELKPLALDPGQFLTKLNKDLYAILRNTGSPLLTTAFYLVADWKSRQIRYANAGHPKPLHLRHSNSDVVPLANSDGKSQAALGVFGDAKYKTTEAAVHPGDVLMLFTDGLFEVNNAANELYTQAMLTEEVKRLGLLPAGELFDELLARIKFFAGGEAFADDVCLIGMELADVRRK
jgi:sigma-B regulation protein RsbU (phosphoserine phosphatase)